MVFIWILQDFEFEFKTKSQNLISKWPTLAKKILNLVDLKKNYDAIKFSTCKYSFDKNIKDNSKFFLFLK